MTRHIPTIRNGTLHEYTEEKPDTEAIAVESVAWYTWLEDHRSFRVEDPASTFTARKEQRAGSWYWYAYRRQAGRLHTAYLGKSAELSMTHLHVIAAELAGVDDSRPLRTAAGERVPNLPTSHSPQQANVTASGPMPLHNLPRPLTSLVGREQERAAAEALLQHPDVCLLSMVGTAGVGKTRLALQVVTDLLKSFTDGVFFVALAPIRDPELVLSTVAQTLGLRVTGNQSFLDVLKVYLRDKHCLVVLDNFEQVVSAAPQLSDLLEACPGVKLLITSREVLHLRAEHQFSVPPLALPDHRRLPDEQTLAHIAAVELFLQRAQAIKSDFLLTRNNAAVIAEICLRLDGLPLAIELAAARIKVFTPEALLARLDHRLQVLTGGTRDLPERQRTLRATIAWSYELLPAKEQRLFRRLAVFVGGCTLEAVEAVSTGVGDTDTNVLEGMISLVDKSLLQQTGQDGEEPRFAILETIREYGLEVLALYGEAPATHQVHAAYYLALAEEAEPHLLRAKIMQWLDQLEGEHENLRAALQWFLTTQKSEQGLRMSGALWYFWGSRHLLEGQNWYEHVLAIGKEDITEARAKALHGASILAYFQGNYPRATELVEASLKIARMLEDKRRIALSLNTRGQIALITADYATMRTMIEECVPLHREMGDHFWLALGLYLSAYNFHVSGDQVRASSVAEEALAVHRKVGEPITMVRTVHALGYFAYIQRDFVSAYGHYEESLQISIAIGDKPLMTACLIGLGTIAAVQGQMVRAAQLWGAATGTILTADLGMYDWYTNILSAQVDYQHWSTHVRTELGEEAFKRAWEEGRAMAVEQFLVTQGNRSLVQPSSDERAMPSRIPSPPSPVKLTPREMDVLHLLAQGLSSAQIAEQLVIGLVTVNSHVRSIYNKLGVTSRSAATRYALEHHLL